MCRNPSVQESVYEVGSMCEGGVCVRENLCVRLREWGRISLRVGQCEREGQCVGGL